MRSHKSAPAPAPLRRRILSLLAAATLGAGLDGCVQTPISQNPGSGSPSSSTSQPAPEEVPAEQTTEPTSTPEPDQTPADPAPDAKAQAELLEKYAERERTSLAPILEQYKEIYADINVLTQAPGTVIFDYTYAAALDVAATQANLEAMIPDLTKEIDDSVFPQMRSFGLEGPLEVVYSYKGPDQALVWEHSFTSDSN